MGTTIRDVARRAGVSISTVSRVLNNTCPVSDTKRRAVEEAAEVLGYTPNPVARSLLNQQTGGLGVLLPFVGGEFFSELLTGLDLATQSNDYFLLITSSHRSHSEFLAALKGLHKRVDGLLIMATEMQPEDLRAHLPQNTPTVFVNTNTDGHDFDVINFDNYGGVYELTTHLIEQGHRRIAVITGPEGANDAVERLRGYEAALRAHDIALDPALVLQGDFTREAGYAAVPRLLQLDPRPTAVLAANDYCAIGALRGLLEAGLRVPEDISLTGFDDIPSAHYTTPPLSTIRVPAQQMGMLAVERLIARIQGRSGGKTISEPLATEVVLRGSTAPPPP